MSFMRHWTELKSENKPISYIAMASQTMWSLSLIHILIDFVARLYDLTSLQAAQKLAYDFGIDPDKPPAAAALQKPKYPMARCV